MPDRACTAPAPGAHSLPAGQRPSFVAADAPRAFRQPERSLLRQVELGLSAVAAVAPDGGVADHPDLGPLARFIAAMVHANDWPFVRALRSLLGVAERRASPMLSDAPCVEALARLAGAWRSWRRRPEDWDDRTPTARRQFAAIVRHLLSDYPVPRFFDAAWFDTADGSDAQRRWFVHVGAGQNLRTADGLPFPLTKAMAHHVMLAPAHLSVTGALRWGQVRGLGGAERLARAVVGTRLGAPAADEPFWLTVLQFFVAHPMLDPGQVGPIVDYLHVQRFEPAPAVHGDADGRPPQPDLTMKGRTPDSLLRQVDAWHRVLGRSTAGVALRWHPSGVADFEHVEGEPDRPRVFTVTELLSGRELLDEGRVMGHCVGTYAQSCAWGRCAIFSLREDAAAGPQRRLTIEVDRSSRTIVQARGHRNRLPDPADARVLRAWAWTAGLTVAPNVFRL